MTDMNVRKSTRLTAVTGLMLAMTLILVFTPIGFIQVPPVSITIMHLPVIIAGIVAGPISGLIVGIGMGLASMFKALTSINPVDKLFINPLISVVPRALIGVTAYYAYTAVRNAMVALKQGAVSQSVAATVGALVGTLTNTILVLSMLYLVHFAGTENAVAWILGVISINMLLEIVVAIAVCAPVVVVITKIFNK